MCTIGLLDGKILFKNQDGEGQSNIKIRKEDNLIEVFCPVLNRPVAIYTKKGIGIVTALVDTDEATAPLDWIKNRISDINSAEEFIQLLKQGPDFTGFNIIIADKNKGFAVEVSGKKVIATEIKTAARTNHFFLIKSGPQKPEDNPSSFIRHARAEKLCKKLPSTTESAKKILSDNEKGNSDNSIFRSGRINTQCSIIIDLPNNRLLYTKYPGNNKYQEITF